MSAPRQALVLLLVVAIAQSIWYWPRLPEVVPSHFDGLGRPNGWMSRQALIALYLGMLVGTSLLLSGITSIVSRSPTSMVNLNHKEYWLAPERAAETWAYLDRQLGWMAVATSALLVAVFELTFRASIAPDHRMSAAAMGTVLGVYLTWTAVWTIRLIARFEQVPTPGAPIR